MKARSTTVKLQFLTKEKNDIEDQIIKGDMLLHALKEKDTDFAMEILNSPGSMDFINFRFHDREVTDIEGRKRHRFYFNDQHSNLPKTALTMACYFGQIDIVRLLIEKKAHVNLTSNLYSPLEYAIVQRKFLKEKVPLDNYKKIAQILLMNGATYNNTLKQFDEDNLLQELCEDMFLTKEYSQQEEKRSLKL